jgi:signal transduction histidine kinase/CheY-like chemotaxis protein
MPLPALIRTDRLVTRALVMMVAAAAIMVANRFTVAREQAEMLRELTVRHAAEITRDELGLARDAPAARARLAAALGRDTDARAAVWVGADGTTAFAARDDDTTLRGVEPLLAPSPSSGGTLYFDAALQAREPPGPVAWMPPWQLHEQALPAGGTLRVLVSLRAAREAQLYLVEQALKSVAILIGLVTLFLWWVLRQPRRSLTEAVAFAERLPAGAVAPLPPIDSHLSQIDRLRASLNLVAQTLEQQRRTEREQAAKLHEAAQRANAGSEAKSRFMANMSHEIRTPLNGVIGMCDLLLATALSQQQRHYLAAARASAASLVHIVDEILDLSKIEAGRMTIELGPCALPALLHEIATPFAARACEKGLALLSQICPRLPALVVTDGLRLRQVLTNLIGNAVKFTDEGQVCLQVQAVSAPALGGDRVRLRFEVSDTGPGIPAQAQAAVFEAFTQADSSIVRRFGGTGLGLTISARLVQLMGSQLHLESEVGRGTAFWFELEVSVDGAAVTEPPAALAGARVLWVDPLRESRRWFAKVLESWQVHADMACTLAEGLDWLGPGHGYAAVFVCGSLLTEAPAADAQRLYASRGLARICPMLSPRDRLPAALDDSSDGAHHVHLMLKPLAPRDLQRALAPAAAPAAPAAAPRPLQGLQVLLAEDNEVNTLVARETLGQLGAEVTHASDGNAALAAAPTRRFDLVLLDLQMPGRDGYSVCRELRSRGGALARLPIVAMTAHAYAEESVKLAAAGFDGYVGKPFDARQLAAEVQRVLSARAYDPAPPPAVGIAHASCP